ncbi:MAG: BBP7 family outer membrane beta-barrel protein [Planctomycetaceae bacterium]|jgi:hypothetical protein|nr:BBP7 family outer membrane beta-barrel protein [Planctomycetaceae bacterium]
MTTLKRNSLLTGIAAVLISMFAGSLFAQDGSLRLWKPYSPESFGGSRRGNDGVYGAIDMLYWKIDGPREIPELNYAMQVHQLSTDFQFGTRITFGNRRGHHGWVFSGYNLPGSEAEDTSVGMSWFGEDEMIEYTGLTSQIEYDANGNAHTIYVPFTFTMPAHFFQLNQSDITLRSKTELSNLELMYSYRPHPFHWGEMELFAGVRYWGLNDKLGFAADTTGDWYYFLQDTFVDYLSPASSSEDGIDDEATVAKVTISVMDDEDRDVKNRITGPQIGFNLRRTNSRWTYGADFRFIAGMNMQSFNYREKTLVDMAFGGTHREILLLEHFSEDISQQPTVTWHKNQTVFSPGIELNLSAKWQWTEAVGFHAGFNSTIFDNIARGADIWHTRQPYVFNTGKIDAGGNPITETRFTHKFGIRDQGQAVIAYGVNFGINIRR